MPRSRARLLVLLAALAALGGGLAAPVRASAAVVAPIAAPAETTLVARRDLARGTTLVADDVEVRVTSGARSRGASGEGAPRPALGWVTRRVVRAGEPLRPPAVAPPAVMRAGSPVTVVWTVNGVRITREGTSMGPALVGDAVVVRLDAQRRVTGIAVGPGLVSASTP